jgi:hypothetical protein
VICNGFLNQYDSAPALRGCSRTSVFRRFVVEVLLNDKLVQSSGEVDSEDSVGAWDVERKFSCTVPRKFVSDYGKTMKNRALKRLGFLLGNVRKKPGFAECFA